MPNQRRNDSRLDQVLENEDVEVSGGEGALVLEGEENLDDGFEYGELQHSYRIGLILIRNQCTKWAHSIRNTSKLCYP